MSIKVPGARRARLIATAGVAALGLGACASEGYYNDPYAYDTTYRSDAYAAAPRAADGYADRRYDGDRVLRGPTYPDRYDDRNGRLPATANEYVGIDGARLAHRRFRDGRAEQLDGRCEEKVYLGRGETLSDIAEYCDTPVVALMDANNIRNPNRLAAGQPLFVPAVKGQVYDGAGYGTTGRARLQTTEWRGDIAGAPGHDDDRWRLSASERTHLVRPGETLAGIAGRYRVSLYDLWRLNGSMNPRRLEVGTRLVLPAQSYFDGDEIGSRTVMVDRRSFDPLVSITPTRGTYDTEITLLAEGYPENSNVVVLGGPTKDDLRVVAEAKVGPNGRVRTKLHPEDDWGLDDRAVFGVRTRDEKRFAYSEPFSLERAERRVAAAEERVDDRQRAVERRERALEDREDRLERKARRIDERQEREGYYREDVRYERDRRYDDPYARRKTLDPYADAGRRDDNWELVRGVEGDRDRGWFNFGDRNDVNGRVYQDGLVAISGVITPEGVKCPALRDDTGRMYNLLGDLEGYDKGDRVLVRGAITADDDICGQAETLQVRTIEATAW